LVSMNSSFFSLYPYVSSPSWAPCLTTERAEGERPAQCCGHLGRSTVYQVCLILLIACLAE
jgi:hypothetical protein